MEVEIYITSQAYGEFYNYSVKGSLSLSENSFTLEYGLDGDKCLLVCDGGGILQTREGAMNYSVKFIPHAKCRFEFSEGGFGFYREVDVFKAEASVNETGCAIHITYADCDGRPKDDGAELFIAAVYTK